MNKSDQEFIQQMENCTLEPGTFTHSSHLRLGWLLITEHGVDKAIEEINRILTNYVNHVGATDKFHVTVTHASMVLIHERMGAEQSSFAEFLESNPDLSSNLKGLIQEKYSIDVFASTEAKNEYIAPDK